MTPNNPYFLGNIDEDFISFTLNDGFHNKPFTFHHNGVNWSVVNDDDEPPEMIKTFHLRHGDSVSFSMYGRVWVFNFSQKSPFLITYYEDKPENTGIKE